MNATCQANSTCHKIPHKDEYDCICDPGTVPDKSGGEVRCLGMFDMIIGLSLLLCVFEDFNTITWREILDMHAHAENIQT